MLWVPVYENPVTLAKGQQQIADVFCLLGIVPGATWSELGDICESHLYGTCGPKRLEGQDGH